MNLIGEISRFVFVRYSVCFMRKFKANYFAETCFEFN